MYFYELITIDPIDSFKHYYYFRSNTHYIFSKDFYPKKLWQIKEDYAEEWIATNYVNIFYYLWHKYFKKQGTFDSSGGIRVDWEKC